jgi:hypothetical protein
MKRRDDIADVTCACGCGRPSKLHYGKPLLSAECREQRLQERRRRSQQERRDSGKAAKRAALHKALPTRHLVRTFEDHVEARAPQPKCASCAGIPWGRELGRVDEWGKPVSVVPPYTGPGAPAPVCRTCGAPYAPESPLPRASVLVSSAGVAVRAAPMHGISLDPARTRPSRAKVAS